MQEQQSILGTRYAKKIIQLRHRANCHNCSYSVMILNIYFVEIYSAPEKTVIRVPVNGQAYPFLCTDRTEFISLITTDTLRFEPNLADKPSKILKSSSIQPELYIFPYKRQKCKVISTGIPKAISRREQCGRSKRNVSGGSAFNADRAKVKNGHARFKKTRGEYIRLDWMPVEVRKVPPRAQSRER